MEPKVTRKDLLTAGFPLAPPVARVEAQEVTLAAGTRAPLHIHPCPAMGVITEGTITFQIEGEPQQILETGGTFYEPAGVSVVKFNNESREPAKFVVFYLLGPDDKETIQVL